MEDSQEQSNNRPWLFRKGISGNPGGRPKGSKSLKTRAREYLEGLSDEEAIEYFEGLNKLDVWKMAEGMPDTRTDLTTNGKDLPTPIINVSRNDSVQENKPTEAES